ncbi:hypothetical protein Y788_02355 [Pantoea dispersa 625]|nr:hypothetical protein Y788_02355 [Pantoea dispersa 625]
MVLQNSRHITRSQRVTNRSWLSCGNSGAATAVSGTLRCTCRAMPSTITPPATSRMAANCQPSTKPINTSVAGLSSGFASQNAIAAPLETCAWRRPTVTGAAQQLHIMPGRPKPVPTSVAPRRLLPIRRSSQRRGISTCTSEPSTTPSTAAFHTARK